MSQDVAQAPTDDHNINYEASYIHTIPVLIKTSSSSRWTFLHNSQVVRPDRPFRNWIHLHQILHHHRISHRRSSPGIFGTHRTHPRKRPRTRTAWTRTQTMILPPLKRKIHRKVVTCHGACRLQTLWPNEYLLILCYRTNRLVLNMYSWLDGLTHEHRALRLSSPRTRGMGQ